MDSVEVEEETTIWTCYRTGAVQDQKKPTIQNNTNLEQGTSRNQDGTSAHLQEASAETEDRELLWRSKPSVKMDMELSLNRLEFIFYSFIFLLKYFLGSLSY